MIVKKLKLENIRSYRSQIVEFPLGRTLFEGDIGSGKSTILMAIEFALFGLGSEKPASLLKAGETDGSVSMIFESDGKEYMVQRRILKKRNTYLQGECVLRVGDEHKQYSASEIKEKILEILDFNEPPDPKAQSLIYRYAVYTPQEEIKNVLALKPDLRLQTLRKAFRIEDYKVAAENAKGLYGQIKQRVRDFTIQTSDIPELNVKISKLASSMIEKSGEMKRLQKEQAEKKDLLSELKVESEYLERERISLGAETGKIGDLRASIDRMNRELESSGRRERDLAARVEVIVPKLSLLKSRKSPSEKDLKQLQTEIQDHEKRERRLRETETKIRTKLEDYDSILKEKVCPTCDRQIEADSFMEKLRHKEDELEISHAAVEECTTEIVKLKEILELRRNYEQEQLSLKDLLSKRSEYEEDLKACKAKIEDDSRAITESKSKLESAQSSFLKLESIESQLNQLRRKIDMYNENLRELGQKIAEYNAHLRDWEDESKELQDTLKKKLKQKEKAEKLGEHLIWIQDFFLPCIESIERQVLVNINLDFDSRFRHWFSMVVDDPSKDAKIDEDFTPVIQQDGIDQDVSSLSGGEKTSVALAYRLALNNIVRKVSTGMQSNVLILDEPTDGFSKEQLGKVREILDELECPQIILVSHERELESFADQIFRVTKVNGVSTISRN